jgi:hypothetical protein
LDHQQVDDFPPYACSSFLDREGHDYDYEPDQSSPSKARVTATYAVIDTLSSVGGPLHAAARTMEEQADDSLDSTLSCCQWLQDAAATAAAAAAGGGCEAVRGGDVDEFLTVG